MMFQLSSEIKLVIKATGLLFEINGSSSSESSSLIISFLSDDFCLFLGCDDDDEFEEGPGLCKDATPSTSSLTLEISRASKISV